MGTQVPFGADTATATSTATSYLSSVNVSARRTDSAGKGPQIITHAMAYISDNDGTGVTCRLSANGYTSNALSLQKGTTPKTTGYVNLTSPTFIANGNSAVKFGYSNANGKIARRQSSGGIIYGGYEYIQAPSAPLGFSVDSASMSQVSFSWAPPADDGGSPITGYNIYRVDGTSYIKIGTTTETFYTFTPEATFYAYNTTYTHVVRASNLVTDTALSDSVNSNYGTFTLVFPVPAAGGTTGPVAPSGLTATTNTALDSSFKVYWNSVSNATSYKLYIGTKLVKTVLASERPTSSKPLIIYPLGLTWGTSNYTFDQAITISPLTVYSISVATADSSTGPKSNPVDVVSSGKPLAPTGLLAVAPASSLQQIDLSWIPPQKTVTVNNSNINVGRGLPAMTRYSIYKKRDSDANYSLVNGNVDSSVTTYSVMSLDGSGGSGYTFYIEANSDLGASPNSGTAYAVPNILLSGPDAYPVEAVAGRILLKWGSTATSTFKVINAANNEVLATLSKDISPKQYAVDGLNPDTEYSFYIQPDSTALASLTPSISVSPYGFSVQPIGNTTAIPNVTNAEIDGNQTVSSDSTPSLIKYVVSGASNVEASDIISSTAVVNNTTNLALNGKHIVSDVSVSSTSGHSITYNLDGTPISETGVSRFTLINMTNQYINTTSATVLSVAEGEPGGTVDNRYVTYVKSMASATIDKIVSASNNVVTVTTNSAHSFIVGEKIVVSELASPYAGLNGNSYSITSIGSDDKTVVFVANLGSVTLADVSAGKLELELPTATIDGTEAKSALGVPYNLLTNLSQSAFNVTGRPIIATTENTITYTRDVASVSTASRSGSEVTIVTTGAHGFLVGDSITVYGYESGNTFLPIAGTWTVTAVSGSPTVNTLKYNTSASGNISSGTGQTDGRIKYADVSEAISSGTVYNATNRDIFNSTNDYDYVSSTPDYRTITYPLETDLNGGVNIGNIPATIYSVARTGTTVTLTTTAAHNFLVGETITVTGLPITKREAEGTYVILSIPTSTTLTYTTSTNGTINADDISSSSATVTTSSRGVLEPLSGVYPTTTVDGTKLDVSYRSGWLA